MGTDEETNVRVSFRLELSDDREIGCEDDEEDEVVDGGMC